MSRVTYHRLNAIARATIQDHGCSVAAFIRAHDPDGQWRGDSCGCSDDRCKDGYHHEPWEDCGCLEAVLRDPEAWGLTLPHLSDQRVRVGS